MDWHNKNVVQVIKWFDTSLTNGLTSQQAQQRIQENGKNMLLEKKQTSFFVKLLYQLKDFMVVVLIVAAVISLITAIYNGEGDYSEPLIIIAIVVFNAVVGVIQESKAERALQALKEENPKTTKVLRNGMVSEIPVTQLVTGDIVHISQGDVVPADCRICECMGFMTTEAGLTGESAPVEKNNALLDKSIALAERKNMVYMGTQAISGNATCVVVATGMNTEMGKIAEMLSTQEQQETPLQKRLGEIGKLLGIGALAICFVIFVIGIFQQRPVLDMLMTAVSLAVAAIPEGLPAIVTVMLAIGVQTMARENAVVRRLSAVEALGSATVICTDKTGTLTQNKMVVNKVYGFDRDKIIRAAALCTNVEKGENCWLGDPTEVAMVECVGFNESVDMPRVNEISFTSERKIMTGIYTKKEKLYAISKGAPEVVLSKCCKKMDKNGEQMLNGMGRKHLISVSNEFEREGLRVLAVAYRELENNSNDSKTVECDLCFLGFVALRDEPRPEAKMAVTTCKMAGIRPIMITGDSILTAGAIGKAVGIETNGVITGNQLEKADEQQISEFLMDNNVFARVSPEHKLKIVNALKEKGEIVAMTGDACNDAPALKAADIGCAMGLCGTQVAREAADIVLTDDNFATIVKAVSCGRGIYANIKKAVHFLLSSNIGEIITVFSSMCCSFAAPLAPVQLLWINLVTDSLPAIALGLEPLEDDVMQQKPNSDSSIFAKEKWFQIGVEGIMIGMLALVAGGIGKVWFGSEEISQTMTFVTLSISQLVHAFNMRSEKSIFKINVLSNKWLIGAFVVGCALQVSVVGIGALNSVFAVTPLSVNQWLVVAALCLVPIVVVEMEKFFQR